MSSSELVIQIQELSKCFHIYNTPRDRLKQFIIPSLKKIIKIPSKKYFQEFWALKGISFEVKKGETVGIVGRNGSGKSTLLQIISGTITPTNGNVEINGRIAALLELGSGFNPEFTGHENIYMNASILGLSKNEIDHRFNDIIDFADIGDFINQPVKTYSSGMMVRLAFSVAINVEPEILIVDEALSVGDELFQRKCFSRIDDLKKNGTTILLVTHSAPTVIDLCDRAILLDSGSLVSIGNPKKIIEGYQRLLYAPENKKKILIDEIKKISSSENSQLNIKRKQKEIKPRKLVENATHSFYDPALNPENSFGYENNGAVISDPIILNTMDIQVNNLLQGKKYTFNYTVNFNVDASGVKFGSVIKTTTGFHLGGCLSVSPLGESFHDIKLGTKLLVSFEYICHLNPGVYFLNAGVFGSLNDKDGETVLHRVVDAAVFRVLPIENNLKTEVIDFEFSPKVLIHE